MVEILFILAGMVIFAVLCYWITEWTDDDIDVQFIWNRNVLSVGFVVTLLIWVIKVIKTARIAEMEYCEWSVIFVSLFWLMNFSLSKLFHKRFTREKRRWYLSDPTVPAQGKRFPTITIFSVFGTPILIVSDIWFLITSYFL